MCSKFTIKSPEQRKWRRSDDFAVDFKHISHLFIMFITDYEQVNVIWDDGTFCKNSSYSQNMMFDKGLS